MRTVLPVTGICTLSNPRLSQIEGLILQHPELQGEPLWVWQARFYALYLNRFAWDLRGDYPKSHELVQVLGMLKEMGP